MIPLAGTGRGAVLHRHATHQARGAREDLAHEPIGVPLCRRLGARRDLHRCGAGARDRRRPGGTRPDVASGATTGARSRSPRRTTSWEPLGDEHVAPVERVLVVLFDSDLFFANAGVFRREIHQLLTDNPGTRTSSSTPSRWLTSTTPAMIDPRRGAARPHRGSRRGHHRAAERRRARDAATILRPGRARDPVLRQRGRGRRARSTKDG